MHAVSSACGQTGKGSGHSVENGSRALLRRRQQQPGEMYGLLVAQPERGLHHVCKHGKGTV